MNRQPTFGYMDNDNQIVQVKITPDRVEIDQALDLDSTHV
jgi:hypothetical protein